MKAAILYGRADVRIGNVPAPVPGAGEVRVEIKAALTCGTDLKVFKRGYHAKMIVPPSVFGHELAGVIAETGPGVSGWEKGDPVAVANSAPCGECYYCQHYQENLCEDLVFLNGAYAESVLVPARVVEKNLLRLPAATSYRDAALVEPLACVVQGIRDCQLQTGQNVLVIGAGPIGLMFTRLAKNSGCSITVAGRGSERLSKARELGADWIIDAEGRPDLGEANPGQRFDVVIEAVGKPETWEAAVKLARKGGTVNLFGGCPAGSSVTLDTSWMHYSSLRLVSSFHHTPQTIRRALTLIGDGLIRADDFVNGECSLSQLPELFQSMAKGNRAVKTFIQVAE